VIVESAGVLKCWPSCSPKGEGAINYPVIGEELCYEREDIKILFGLDGAANFIFSNPILLPDINQPVLLIINQ
jgi:hypothetical protein